MFNLETLYWFKKLRTSNYVDSYSPLDILCDLTIELIYLQDHAWTFAKWFLFWDMNPSDVKTVNPRR